MFKRVMILSAVVSGVLTAVMIGIYTAYPSEWLETLAITMGTIAYHFIMRLVVGVAWCPFQHRVNPASPWFREKPWEAAVYKRLRVKRWKAYLPTYDPASFDIEKHTPEELLAAMCHSERVHETIAALSFVPLFGTIWFHAFPAFLITSVLAAVFDTLFVILQRYNRPRMAILMKRQKRQDR